MDIVELTPGTDLLHSMRSVGYSFEAAVADIVDNSITAGAKRVEILVDVVHGRWISIKDDGRGMSKSEAMEALRLAGTARTTEESTDSLGRFGLGLKTASLSQGRRLEVITRQNRDLVGLAWDIDTVTAQGKWAVELLSEDHVASAPKSLAADHGGSGTQVLWSKLDYLTGKADDVASHLSLKVDALRSHLGLVFHRFLDDRDGLTITLNGTAVAPVDPFLEAHPKTQRTPEQRLQIHGLPVVLQGFTLPHAKYLEGETRRRPDLGPGLRENQGFYIYRNRRLISSGGWFGLRPKKELTKQARVRVDITDGLDFLWQVDIRKARSEPPAEFRRLVRPLMERLVVRSEKVHTFRGRSLKPVSYEHLWNKVETRERVEFQVNGNHPSVHRLMEGMGRQERALFQDLLNDLADLFPYYDTYLAAAKNQLPESSTVTSDEIRQKLIKLRDSGFGLDEVEELVRDAEPYRDCLELDALLKEVWASA